MANQIDDRRRRVRWANRRVRTDRVILGEIFYEPGGFFGPRRQPDFQLVLLRSGSGRVTVDRAERPLELGRIHLFTPGHDEHFHFDARRQTHHVWCSIRPEHLPEAMRPKLLEAPRSVPQSPAWDHLLAAALALPLPLEEAAAAEVDLLGLACFAEYLRLAGDALAVTGEGDPVLKARRHMSQHLGDEDCLEQAARASGVSRNTLINHFQRQLGLTFPHLRTANSPWLACASHFSSVLCED